MEIVPLHKTKFTKRMMTSEEMRIVVNLTRGEPDRMELLLRELREQDHQFKVIEARLPAIRLKMQPALCVFISYISSNLGSVSLYLHSMFHYRKENGIWHDDPVTVTHFLEAFGDGFPDEASLEAAWAAQKTPTGQNAVDMNSSYVL